MVFNYCFMQKSCGDTTGIFEAAKSFFFKVFLACGIQLFIGDIDCMTNE